MTRVKLPSNGKLEGLPSEVKIRPFRMLQHKRISATVTRYFEDALTEAFDECIEYDDGQPFISSDLFTEEDRRYLMLWQIINSKGKEYTFFFNCRGKVRRRAIDGVLEDGEGCGAEGLKHVQDLSVLKITPLSEEYKDMVSIRVSGGGILTLSIPRHRDIRLAERYVDEWRQFQSDQFVKGYIERARAKFLEEKRGVLDADKLADMNLGVWNTEAEKAFIEYMETDEEFDLQLEYLLDALSIMVYVSRINGDSVSIQERMKFFEEELIISDVALLRAFMESVGDYGVATEVEVTCDKCGGMSVLPIPFRRDVLFPIIARKGDFENAVAAVALHGAVDGADGRDGRDGV